MLNLLSSRPRPVLFAALLPILVCCSLAGCGGSSGGSSTSSAASGSSTSAPAATATTSAQKETPSATTTTPSADTSAKPSGEPAEPSIKPELRRKLIKLADCLRKQGVKIPPANTSGHGPLFNTQGLDTSSPQYQAAERKCVSVLGSALKKK